MDEMVLNDGLSSGVALEIYGNLSAQDDGDTMRHGMIHRAMRHAKHREMMHHMMQRHEMHRRMMHRSTRRGLDD